MLIWITLQEFLNDILSLQHRTVARILWDQLPWCKLCTLRVLIATTVIIIKHKSCLFKKNKCSLHVRKNVKCQTKVSFDWPLIILMSLAPSPMANVTVSMLPLTQLTIMAFCSGMSRQQITARHIQATSKNSRSSSTLPRTCSCSHSTRHVHKNTANREMENARLENDN